MNIPELSPRYATPRNPSRATDGDNVARIAEKLGTPLMPWQKMVADVASEIDPETGTYYYNEVILSTPRQSGKTVLINCYGQRNCLWGKDRKIVYIAQTGKDAGDRFREFIKPYYPVAKTILAKLVNEPRLSNGSMRLPFKNGSILMPSAVTDSSGHGSQSDLVFVDEVFSMSAEKHKTLVDAFGPTMNTRLAVTGVRPQIWWVSTEGTADSEAFNAILDNARAGKLPERTCFFDFGIPFTDNPEDLATVWVHHPAAGILFDYSQLKDFRALFKDDAAGWARAYANIRDTGVQERIISAGVWEQTHAQPVTPDAATDIAFGIAVQLGGQTTSICACYTHPITGKPCVQLVDTLQGSTRTVERIKQLHERYNAPILLDYKGPSAPLADILRSTTNEDGTNSYNLLDVSMRDLTNVASIFVNALIEQDVRHATDPDLDTAAQLAAARQVGDSYVFERRTNGNIAPVEAAAFAYYAYKHRPEEFDKLQIF